MKLDIKNIGIVKEAKLDIEGLTVITGSNNSGKTTVGKVLYSIINAVENINEFALLDRKSYLANKILKVYDLYAFDLYFDILIYDNEEYIPTSIIYKLFHTAKKSFSEYPNTNSIREFISNSKKYIIKENVETILQMFDNTNEAIVQSIENQKGNLNKFLSSLINVVEEIEVELAQGLQINDYIRNRIFRSLKSEFNNQITPINDSSKAGVIKLYADEVDFFDIKLTNEGIVNDNIYKSSPAKEIYFIDDPYIVDNWKPKKEPIATSRFGRRHIVENSSFITGLKNHSEKIECIISNDSNNNNLYVNINNSKNSENILQKINEILPGHFVQDKDRYIESETKLDIRNLATGSKSFLILKQLILSGKINENTIVVFDEPEVHLHPEWQNIFAEIIVLLIKELNANIMMTTHSMQFLLALETFTKKYSTTKKAHYYISKVGDDKEFVEITKKINQAYAKLSEPLVIIDNLNRELNKF